MSVAHLGKLHKELTPAKDEKRLDSFGDALPPGARLRLGRTFVYHNTAVWAVAYSPDSKLLVSTAYQKARLWELATGKEIRQFQGHDGIVNSAAFSPDGQRLATMDFYSLCLWETGSGKLLRRLEPFTNGKHRGFCALAFSPDGQTLANAGHERTIQLWDAATLKEVGQLVGHRKPVRQVAFSPDGRFLASLDDDRAIRLWEVATKRTLYQFEGSQLVFLPDGKTLATGLKDTLRVWDIGTGKELRHIELRHKTAFDLLHTRMAVSPDGKTLATRGMPYTVCLWDLATGKMVRQFFGHRSDVCALAFSPDGKTVASGSSDYTFRVWDLATGREVHPFPGHLGEILALAVAQDGKTLATSSKGARAIHLWDAAGGRQLRKLDLGQQQYSGNAAALAFTPDGRTLVAVGRPSRRWDVATGKEIARHADAGDWVPSRALSPNIRMFAISDNHGLIRVSDVATGKPLRQFPWPSTPRTENEDPPGVACLAFCPDSATLAAAAFGEQDLYLWDLGAGKKPRSFRHPYSPTKPWELRWLALAFSPDGRALAGLALHPIKAGKKEPYTTTIHLWEVATGKVRLKLEDPQASLTALAFSPDGRILATAGKDTVIRFWDVGTGKELGSLQGHQGAVTTVAFLPDGNTLISCSADTTVLVWDIPVSVRKPPAAQAELSPQDLEILWAELASEDAAKAYHAMFMLSRSPSQGAAVPFLKKQVRPVPLVDAGRIARLIADLQSDQFPVRDKATRTLAELGLLAKPALEKALAGRPALEARRRAQHLLDEMETFVLTAEDLRAGRAIEVLEKTGTLQARQVLEHLTRGASGARITEDARSAVQRLDRAGAAPP